jgi:hypothetical protein
MKILWRSCEVLPCHLPRKRTKKQRRVVDSIIGTPPVFYMNIAIMPSSLGRLNVLYIVYYEVSETGSSVSILSGYGLDDRSVVVQSAAEAKDFSFSLCVQTGSGPHQASCAMGTGGPFPGGKARPGCDADHSPPPSVEVDNEYELYLLPLQALPWRVVGEL